MTFWKKVGDVKLFKMEIGSKVGWCVMVSRGISWNTGSCLLQTCPTFGVKQCNDSIWKIENHLMLNPPAHYNWILAPWSWVQSGLEEERTECLL